MKMISKFSILAAMVLTGFASLGLEEKTQVRAEESQKQLFDFENGLDGWTGDNIGEIRDENHKFWGERTFNSKGNFLCGEVNESLTGTLRSTSFVLGGDGYVSALIGGNKDNYVAVVDDASGEVLLRLVNESFADPVPARQWNMVYTYGQVDASHLGKQVHLEIVDTTINGFGAIIVDDIKASLTAEDVISDFYAERDRMVGINDVSSISTLDWYDSVQLPFLGEANNLITNPDFENGFEGWEYIGDGLNANPVREATHYWGEDVPFNNHGQKLFCGWDAAGDESLSYGIKSSTFTLGGSGVISFRMGGRNALAKVVLENGGVVTSYKNTQYNGAEFPLVANGNRQGTMTTFVADLSSYVGLPMHLEFYDSDNLGDWGVLFVDDIRTYYHVAPTTRSLSNMAVQNYKISEGNNYSNNCILITATQVEDHEASNLHVFLNKFYGYLNTNSICNVIGNEEMYNELMRLYTALTPDEKAIADVRPSLEVSLRETLEYMENVVSFTPEVKIQESRDTMITIQDNSMIMIIAVALISLIPIAAYAIIKKRKFNR